MTTETCLFFVYEVYWIKSSFTGIFKKLIYLIMYEEKMFAEYVNDTTLLQIY